MPVFTQSHMIRGFGVYPRCWMLAVFHQRPGKTCNHPSIHPSHRPIHLSIPSTHPPIHIPTLQTPAHGVSKIKKTHTRKEKKRKENRGEEGKKDGDACRVCKISKKKQQKKHKKRRLRCYTDMRHLHTQSSGVERSRAESSKVEFTLQTTCTPTMQHMP